MIPKKKTGAWVALDETGNGFVVKQHDPGRDTVTVERAGRTFLLELRTAKIAANAAAFPGNPALASVSGTAIPDEIRRQDALTNEINRRLAVRSQANSAARRL